MDIKIVSAITRLANYMPLGSYVIYTALETYSFSLGATPAPVTTIVQTPAANYTCYYYPGTSFTYRTCTDDQSNALKISLAIGFFLAVFLSFLKQIPKNGTPPLAPKDEEKEKEEEDDQGVGGGEANNPIRQKKQQKGSSKKTRKYRRGVLYAEGNIYYLDFGDHHIWGHAALSFVAFGTLSLFSASVSQCLFPKVRSWIFVFTQVVLLVICCFIAMFWIDDPTLSIGLMVVPTTDDHSTQTGNDSARPGTGSGNGSSNPANSITTAPVATFNASTSTTALPMTSFRVSKDHLSTTSGLANIALTDTSLNSPMSMSSTSGFSNASSTTTLAYGSGGTGIVGTTPTTRMNLVTKGRAPTMSSVNEKEGQESMDEKASQPNHGPDLNFDCNHIHHHHNHHHDQQQQQRNDLISTTSPVSGLSPLSESRVRVEEAKDHLSLKMDEA